MPLVVRSAVQGKERYLVVAMLLEATVVRCRDKHNVAKIVNVHEPSWLLQVMQ